MLERILSSVVSYSTGTYTNQGRRHGGDDVVAMTDRPQAGRGHEA
jgi:hypothetical protein